MSTTAFEFNGAKFVTNNYSAILDNDEAPKEFHLIQDFLAHSELMRQENMNIVYYARFCQLIFSYCFPHVPIPETGNELPFKITKRAFTDLIKKDSKKPHVPVFAIPVTVQDKLRVALPDKYSALFSDENIPQPSPSTVDPEPVPTSGPSQKGPVVKSTHTLPSGSSQQGPVEKSSPKRILRSTKSPTKPSPPPRKRRFLQKLSDSDSDEAPPPPPPAKKQRKKIKPTNITDLTVEPSQAENQTQAMISFSEQPSSAEPILIEPLSAVPLETAEADKQMSEALSDQIDQTAGTKSDEVLKLNQESLIQHEEMLAADAKVSERASYDPSKSEDAQIEMVLQLIQDSLFQPEAFVAAPAQEIPTAANSDAATEALESHTLSIFADDIDDEDAPEVTSTPIQPSGLPLLISEPVRAPTPEKDDSPIQALSPVRESFPVRAPSVPSSTLPSFVASRRKVCSLSYYPRMCRATPPTIEARLTSIEATQMSMQHILTDLSASVAQLVQVLTSADVKKGEKTSKDKCKPDQQMKRKKPDDDEEEKGEMSKQQKLLQIKETKKNSKEAASSDRPPRESQKQKSLELTVVTQAQSIRKAVRDSDAVSKEINLVSSEVEKKKEKLVAEAEKLIEAGDPESQKFCQTLKFRGKETTLFYKSPSLQAIDEAMARKIFEKENPGVDIEAIRLEEERLAAEKKKISKTKSDEQRQITHSSQKQKIPKQKGIVIIEVNYTDINRPRTRSQTQSESDAADNGKKPVDGVPSVPPVIKRSEAGLTRRRKGDDRSISNMTLTSDNAQVKASVTKEKIDNAKVSWLKINSEKIQDQKKRSLYGSLGTSLYKESSMLTRVRTHGTRGKEAYDTTGLGHKKEKIQTGSATTFRDPYPLTEKLGDAVTQKDLDKVESVQILMDTHDGTGDKEKIAIFLDEFIRPNIQRLSLRFVYCHGVADLQGHLLPHKLER
ncbi:uncharacterized protein LOC135148454 [Daucus carota subsp. sativus]|uniref:uncharacterized protein LOC135148454 n=1 Tax=Daucus carota subsp. sativus TaxID=79200 RepID=UPI003083D6D8